jgi:hypothetical protein
MRERLVEAAIQKLLDERGYFPSWSETQEATGIHRPELARILWNLQKSGVISCAGNGMSRACVLNTPRETLLRRLRGVLGEAESGLRAADAGVVRRVSEAFVAMLGEVYGGAA